LAALLAAGLALAGEAAVRPQALPAAVERGSEIAHARCASCHAVALETRSPSHDAPQFRVLSRLYSAGDLRRKLAAIAEHGHFEMPAVSVREDEIEDVAAYIASLDPGPPDEAPTSL
jgi:mono/diheme cytochrome c family protein